MGLFDVKTLSLVALVTSLLLPLVLTTSAQFTSSNTPATRTLIHGALAYAVGFLLLALRGSIPDWLSFFIGNVLIVGGFAELAIGLQMYLRGQENRRWMVLLTAGNAVGMFWFVIVSPDPSQRVFTSSLFLLPICIVLSVEFLAAARRSGASKERGASAEKRLLLALAVVFSLSALSFTWRAHNFWNVYGEIDPATTGGRTWGLSFMVGVLLNIMLATCMPLLISRRNQRELALSQALLQETEHLADVGSFLYSPQDDHIKPNGVMCRWLDVAPLSRVPLARFLDRLDDSHAKALQSHVDAIASGRDSQWADEFRMTSPDGKEHRWLSVHCGGGHNAAGLPYVIVSARNVTEFKVATEAAIVARNEADRANAAKSAFLANMSHEIRTPMNGVLGLTRLCLDGDLPPKERHLIEKCHGAAQTLLGVVNDILDFSKIEAGKLSVEHTPFNLAATIHNARNLFELTAKDKGLRFAVAVAADVPLGLVGDSLRLSQILNNLLSNAIKFTDHGEVRLDVARLPTDDESITLEFAVHDTGIGMSGEQMQHLFQAFSQGDASTTRRFGGTGLGLVICQRLAELMGGRVLVSSTQQRGSSFTVTLPFAATDAAPAQPERRAAPSGQRLQGTRVLLVEDNPTNVLVATLSLEAEGAMVAHCADGLQGVNYLREHAQETDVVLMDIQMPVMDGYTATRHIRDDLALASLPIIAMTANVLDTDREASRLAGMSDHVGKPFDMDHLVKVILRETSRDTGPIIAVPTNENAAEASNAPPAPALGSDLATVALEPALQRMGHNVSLLRQAADSFELGLPEMMASIRSHGPGAPGSLHTLKGLAATLGLPLAAQRAKELETVVRRGDLPEPSHLDHLAQLLDASIRELRQQLQKLDIPKVRPEAAAAEDVHTTLSHLQHLLNQSDLAALEYMALHQSTLRARFGTGMDPLEAALQNLDLEAAAAVCTRLVQVK